MPRLLEWLSNHWPAVLLLVAAGLLYRRRGWAFAAAGVGALAFPPTWAGWLAAGAAGVIVVQFLILLASSAWLTPLAIGVGVVFAAGVGSLLNRWLALAGPELIRVLRSVEFASPWWLLLLAVLPGVVRLSYRSLSGLGPVRRWVAIGLRCVVLTSLILALAEIRLRRPNDSTTVLFLVDRSLSIPQDIDPAVPEDRPLAERDRRWLRVKAFLNEAVARRGAGHERDHAGVIVFGRRPRLVLPPAAVPRLNFDDTFLGSVDEQYTDIAAALKLALASFPEGSGKRVVLLSDGNENLGNAEEQARIAARNGVQIDTVPLAAGYRNENEVLVQAVEAPPQTEQGARLPIRVLVRSYNPNLVVGTLSLRQISEGEREPVAIEPGPGVVQRGPPAVVQLRPGLNAFSFRQQLAGAQRSYTYQAVFQPLSVAGANEALAQGLPGDRVQNNSATTHVVALGRRRVLFVEANGKPNDHENLLNQLQGTGQGKFQVAAVTAGELPVNKADLGVLLSNYDCLVLANVPAEQLTEEQMEMIRGNTHDQGCGLVMIGGPDSFGAGGYQNTAVEKALPVDCDIKSVKVAGKGGLVLVMHACEVADGNALQKQVAKLAIDRLSPVDMVGVVYYGLNHIWHIPFKQIGGQRATMLRQVDRMQPGDMPDFDPALQMGIKELTNPSYNLATKHMIIISDGDPRLTNTGLITDMAKAGITCTTIGIATHGLPEQQKMTQMATGTKGRYYNNPNPKAIPSIYIQETRVVSQSFISEQKFTPQLRLSGGPTDKLAAPLPPLFGFVRTSLKASPLVEMGIEGPSVMDQKFPVLASWQYGLGKAVAFTSDARTKPGRSTWDQDWAASEMYAKFWEQVIGWAIRGVETGKLTMATEYRDGKVRVIVDARDDRNRPMTDLNLKGAVTAPGTTGDGKPIELKFDQKNSGLYEAEFAAEESGSYFVNALARRTATVVENGVEKQVEEADSIRGGVTLPYSPEFADLESNTALLKRLSDATGGRVYAETDAALGDVAKNSTVFRREGDATRGQNPAWFWMVLVAGLTLVADVAVRRIAFEPGELVAVAQKYWERLRGRSASKNEGPQFLERLQSRKAQVGEVLEREKAVKRYEAPEVPVAPPPPEALADRPRPRVPDVAPPPPQAGADDAFARLMKAKKKALEGRDSANEDNPQG